MSGNMSNSCRPVRSSSDGRHTAVLGGFIPQFQVFDLPYIFKDKQQMFKAADGELGRALLKTLADKLQIKGLGFFDDGARCLYSSRRPIVTPADFKGMKVRTMENQLMIKTFNLMGAAATPLPFGEVYSGAPAGSDRRLRRAGPGLLGHEAQRSGQVLLVHRHLHQPGASHGGLEVV